MVKAMPVPALKILLRVMVITSVFQAACSSSGSGSDFWTNSWYFRSAPVEGVAYRTIESGMKGVTGPGGFFKARNTDETVIFSIGTLDLPSADLTAQGPFEKGGSPYYITPLDMSPARSVDDIITLNVVRLLYALDETSEDDLIAISPTTTPVTSDIPEDFFELAPQGINRSDPFAEATKRVFGLESNFAFITYAEAEDNIFSTVTQLAENEGYVGIDPTGPISPQPGDTPLMIASNRGDLNEVLNLLATGEEPDVGRQRDGWTPLMFAAQRGHESVVQALVEAGANVDRRMQDGWTPLMIASQNGHGEVVSNLLNAGANVRTARADNWTALHSAATKNRVDIVEMLIDAGAPLDFEVRGFTPLTFTAQNGTLEVATVLVNAGANLLGAPGDGPTPLYMAVQNGHLELAELLLDMGVDPDEGGTRDAPLVKAVASRRVEFVAPLVEAGANIDIRGRLRGYTALMWAANNNDVEAVVELLRFGADPEMMSNVDTTAREIAERLGHDEIVALLQR